MTKTEYDRRAEELKKQFDTELDEQVEPIIEELPALETLLNTYKDVSKLHIDSGEGVENMLQVVRIEGKILDTIESELDNFSRGSAQDRFTKAKTLIALSQLLELLEHNNEG